MNDKIKQLYDLYVSNGLIKSVDFNTFSSASEEQRSQLYNLGRDNGLFQTTDFNTFNSAFVGGQVNVPYARKEQVQEQVQQPTLKKKEPSSMVSSLETTPSVSQEEPLRTTDYINIEGEAEPKTATVPYAVGMEPKPKVEKVEKKKAPSFLTESISTITPELIAKNEEYVVPQLNYQFGPMGFKFEESGMTGDFMKVTAPNGEQIEISLDPFLSSKEKTESEKLKQFINKYTANIKGLSTLENQYKEENRKFNNQKEVDDAVKLNTDEANSIKNEISLFLQEQKNLDSESKYLQSVPFNERNSKEYLDRFNAYNTKISEIEIKKNDIQRRQKDLSYREGKLNSAIGRYTDMKSKQGTYLGGLWNSVLEGVGSQASGVASTILDIGTFIAPKDGPFMGTYENIDDKIIEVAKEKGIDAPKSGESFAEWSNRVGFYMKLSNEKRQEIIKEAEKRSTKKEITDKELDEGLKYTKSQMLPSIREGARIVFGDDDTTVEWSRAKEQGFWGGAILGLAKSAPAMIGGAGPIGWAQRTAMTFAQVSDDVDKEMSENPEFENISEKEKWFVKGPIGIAVGVLESIGFSNIVKNTGLLNKITMAALNKAGKKTSAKTFADLVKNEVDSMVARGLLTLTGAGLAEAETGALQEAATLGIKDIYNTVKGKEIFETPDFLSADYIKQVATAGAQEAIGGFVLGVPSSVSAAYRKKGFQGMDDVTFRTFEAAANDDNIQKAFVSNLKNNVVNGTMTTEEAKGILNDYRNSVKLFRALPDGLSTEQKKEAMNLLKERSEYEAAIQGKDPAMVKPQQDKINSINERLNKISQDAIQEQTTGQVPVQPTTGVGEKVEERKPETGPEVVTAEGEETIAPKVEEEVTPTVLANVENTTKALEVSLKEGGKVDEEGFQFRNEESVSQIANTFTQDMQDEYQRVVIENEEKTPEQFVSEAYHKAKQDNSNPELVNAVEQSLANEIEVERLERELAKPEVTEEVAPSVGISISNDTDIENLRNTARSKAQAARTESEKKSAETKVRVLDVAQRAIKTLKSILPDFDIVIHDNENSYISEADKARVNRQSGGFFQYKVSPDGKMIGRIDINLSKANARTVAHEVTHAILTKSFGENVKLFNEFRKRLSKVLSSDKNKELNDFANRYIDEDTGELLDVNHEEFLAELTGMLEQQETKISVTTMQKIAALINEFVSKITGGKFTPFKDIKDTKDVVDFFNTVSGAIRKGEAIPLEAREMDIVFETINAEPNTGGEVGTFNIVSKAQMKSPKATEDNRSFIRDLVQDIDIREFNGMPFVTNMYDYTNAGITDLGNGFTINMMGGKSYVPYMMSLQNKKIGDVSNLSAFNSKENAEAFVRNVLGGKANLFAPHSGTMSESWQFQQHTFSELVNLILDKDIMSNDELINIFNKTILSNANNINAFKIFNQKYKGADISNFDSFKSNPKKIVDLLDIQNNFSPDLRKALNNAIASDKTFQKAIGIKNKDQFFERIMDPLNRGAIGGEIISIVKFDPTTLQIVKTDPNKIDHHPSFGWAILAKIDGIYQPSEFHKSSDVTKTYTKYNKDGKQVSRKASEPEFEKKNVSSSAGAIPKVAKLTAPKVKSKAQMVAVAPYFNTQVKTTADANNLRQDENYIKYKESLKEVATLLGFPNATINETIGGYQNDAGEKIVEISNKIDLKDATIEEAAEFAAMAAVIAPEVQESSIAFKYVKENSPSHNANEYVVKVEDLDKAVDALKVAGINNFSIDDNNKTISFINVFEFQDPKLEEKIINFVEELESKGVNYEQPKYKSIKFKYVDKGERKKILRRIESKGSERRRLGEDFRPYIESAIKRDAEFQKTTIDEYLRGRAGNRIFNEPLEGVNEIADRYYQRAFGKPRPKYKGTEELDRERAKRLSDAFIAMKHAPNDPKVRAAYDALVKETIEQYKAFLDAGYSVEINNTEPYRNSQEMIDDLRNNKRIKIFSTESGFGGEKITEKQRKDNPLLAETEFKDVNGEPLLVNDLFRAVHDFFGHAELGNGFGPKGEENAWNVHARMFSPLARKAMTTETRGQNSYVNFSEVNQEADKLREEARKLREEGKIDEANKISDRVVNMTQFAEQKIGLLPDEFTEIDLKDEGDLTRVISKASLTGKDINNVIKRGRAAGVSERAIRTVLKKQGFTDAEIDAAMGVQKPTAKPIAEEKITDIKNAVQRIKDLTRGAKDAKAAWLKASRMVYEFVKDLKDKGKISVGQMTSVIKRFSTVNMLNDDSIIRFVDYMSKVFADATYADRMNNLNSKISAARKNIKTKLGIAEGLMPSITRLFSIDPSLIPDNVLDKYEALVDMMSKKEQVLRLDDINDVTNTVNEILTEVDNELSLVEELADRFESYPDKVIDNGKLNYSATISNMVSDGTITDQEAELMKKYKSKILPKVDKPKMTDQEIEDEKNQLIGLITIMNVDSDRLPTREERDLARSIAKLIKTKALYGLTNSQLKDLIKTIDNINNGYLTHYAQLINERMNAVNNSSTLKSAIDNAKPLVLTKIYNKIKSLFTRKNYVLEMIRRNPLAYIDQVFGNFKTKEIFSSLFEKLSQAHSAFKMESKRIQDVLDNAQNAVAKSFKFDANKTLMSKFKMMTYLIQLEYESNKGSKQVNKASDFIKATIKHIDAGKSQYGERDADMLQKILDQYTNADGDIDLTKLYNSFNQAEREAIGTISKINQSLRDKAVYTASVIRGQKINPLTNYIHLNVLHEHTPTDVGSGVSFANDYNNTIRPSTKAKSLIERTGKVSPLNFDVFASAQRGANFVLTDFYLTEPIRTGRKTLNETKKLLEEKGRMTKLQRDIFNSIETAFEESVEDELVNNFTTNSFADEVIDYMSKTGYRAILSSVTRFVSELSSNIGYAMFAAPKDFATGVANRGVILSANAIDIMKNVGSKQTSRVFPTNTLSGKLVDTSIMSQASGIKGAKSKNVVANKIQQIYNLTAKKYINTVELIADSLISTPDKMVMRPIWFGTFANEFKKITGKDVDFDKIAENDENYLNENSEAINKAKNAADDKSVMAGATDNSFMGILKGKVKPNQSSLLKAWNMYNGFMTRFLIYEYVTARTAVMAAMGNGSMSRKQGVAVLSGVTTRMVTYSLLSTMLGQGLVSLFSDEEDEEEDEKSFIQKFGQSLASAFTGLIFGRDFGNAVKTTINYGIEKANEKYLDFLREGEYDPYKDAIQYTIVPAEKKGPESTDLSDLIKNMMGPFAPAYKTADLAVRKIFEKPKKKEEAIERQKAETNIRIPLEIAGNLGLIPLYKDIRKIVLKNMYSSIKKAEVQAEEKREERELQTQEERNEQSKLLNMLLEEETDSENIKAISRKIKELGETKEEGKARRKMRREEKKSLLKGYESMDDMKRYNPSLYEETFGEGSPYYEKYKDEMLINKELNKLKRKIKDEEMEYIPQPRKRKKKEEGGFGSQKFGSKKFGEEGFGQNTFGTQRFGK